MINLILNCNYKNLKTRFFTFFSNIYILQIRYHKYKKRIKNVEGDFWAGALFGPCSAIICQISPTIL